MMPCFVNTLSGTVPSALSIQERMLGHGPSSDYL